MSAPEEQAPAQPQASQVIIPAGCVRIRHPATDVGDAIVPESAVPMHRRSGWEIAPEDPPADPPADTVAPEPVRAGQESDQAPGADADTRTEEADQDRAPRSARRSRESTKETD